MRSTRFDRAMLERFGLVLVVVAMSSSANAQVAFGPHDIQTVPSLSIPAVGLATMSRCNRIGGCSRKTDTSSLSSDWNTEPMASQTVRRSGDHYVVRVVLRALPQRPVEIIVVRDTRGRCKAAGTTQIRGERAEIHSIYVNVGERLVPRVQWIRIEGQSLRRRHRVWELLEPD